VRVLIPLDLAGARAPGLGAERVEALDGETMGTRWSVKAVVPSGLPADRMRRAILDELDRVVAQMSTWEPRSDLSRFNAAPAGGWQRLPAECLAVLGAALRVSRDTDGAHDPTIGPLVDLWGFGPGPRRETPPSAAAIAAARSRTGWRRIALDPARGRALQTGGVSVDLSSIAKGFAVDQVARALARLGAISHLVEIGGELRGHGAKLDGTPWWVGLERPPATAGEAPAPGDLLVALHGLSVATSGDYRRRFAAGGRWYSHTIDPRTGWPVDHGLASVTVLHPECMLADAFATALMVLGTGPGLACATRLGLAALFVQREPRGLEERMTAAFAAMLE
jgi:FAD:protein FMN transferase